TRAECRHIENDHDEREEVHSHGEPNAGVHRTNTDQPNLSRLAIPNKKWISNLQHTNKHSCDREQVLPSHEYLGTNDVEWGADERPPHIRTFPPSATDTFREDAEEINDARVKLKDQQQANKATQRKGLSLHAGQRAPRERRAIQISGRNGFLRKGALLSDCD